TCLQGLREIGEGGGRAVALRHDCYRQRPTNTKARIVVRNGQVLRRIVRPVDAVADVRWLGERLEAVGASGRDVYGGLLVSGEREGLPLQVRGRISAQVDDHVEDRAG